MLEAISLCEEITGKPFRTKYVDQNRRGDHIWWISDVSRFQQHYPKWRFEYDVPTILNEIHEFNTERWGSECALAAKTTY